MKKGNLLLALCAIITGYNMQGQGFGNTAINWSLPQGGKTLSGHLYGYTSTADAGSYDANNQGWTTMDIDGDGKQDLVVTCEGNGTNRDGFGLPSVPYWKVYFNTGNGFSGTATNWPLPQGGKLLSGHLYGFTSTADAGSYDMNNQGWYTFDINGDAKPDLVVTCEGNGTNRDGFGLPSVPYWKVYLNTGTGFSGTATNWSLPQGGKLLSGHLYGFSGIADAGSYDMNNQGWTVMDIDADGKTDLIVLCEGNGTNRDGYGLPSLPHWKVYLNTGTGFSGTATNWSLPQGGKLLSGHLYGFTSTADAGSYDMNNQGWTVMDIDGDGKQDMIVLCEGNGTNRDGYGLPSLPHWKVYTNTGTGFSGTATNWSLPQGGKLLSGHLYGFTSTADAGSYDMNNQGWSVMDIDGDGKQDMIVLCEGNGTHRDGFGLPSLPIWKVYLNNGTGFSGTVTNWSLPQGGKLLSGHLYGFTSTADAGSYDMNNQGWTVMDIDGDGKQDMIVLCEGNGTHRDGYGLPSLPHWKVYSNLSTVGINGFNNKELFFDIYPNPATDKVAIVSSSSSEVSYVIIDNLGKELKSGSLAFGETTIDISSLPSGIYFVRTSGENPTVKKLIKQ